MIITSQQQSSSLRIAWIVFLFVFYSSCHTKLSLCDNNVIFKLNQESQQYKPINSGININRRFHQETSDISELQYDNNKLATTTRDRRYAGNDEKGKFD